jgi:hypothetical protein
VTLRLPDGGNFQIATRPLPYFDDKGTLILFEGEAVTLSYADDDEKLEHPVLSAVRDPLGPVTLPPPPPSGRSLSFSLRQMESKPDMLLGITNTTKAIIKYDTMVFVPDVVNGNARGGRATTCPVPAPQESQPTLGLEHWAQPLVMVIITNIRALEPGALSSCN